MNASSLEQVWAAKKCYGSSLLPSRPTRGIDPIVSRRSTAYAAVADLVHHLRNELNAAQLARIIHVYSRLIHNPHLTSHLHMVFAKMMANLVDVVVAKDTQQGSARILSAMLETCVDKVHVMTVVQDELTARAAKIKKGEQDVVDIVFIEKARPVAGAIYAVEKPEIQGALLAIRICIR
jgi:transformation/transcription domain-associated protein